MKLATFRRTPSHKPEVGIVRDAEIIPCPVPGLDMRALIEGWSGFAQDAIEWSRSQQALKLETVRLLAPVPNPSKVMAIGLNYADHVAESGLTPPPAQIWFCKTANSVHGPHDPIVIPEVSAQVDYEGEMVAIVGKRAKHVSPENAASHIFGYCVGNDVSVRDWQLRTSQWVLGKSADTHAPFGPWITTADDVPDPHALDIRVFVNGQLRQSSNTQHLIFNVFDQISELSKLMTLEPGDVIFTGTPGGVGVAMNPPRFLKAGDNVACEMARLGRIEATMADETP